jgi:hypothetical protein
MAARGRREAKKSATSAVPVQRQTLTSRRKDLNLSTYKYHALGDYPDLVSRFGTTDNSSTQTVCHFSKIHIIDLLLISAQGELQHKVIKRRYARTNKKKFVSQLARAEARERFIQRFARRLTNRETQSQVSGKRRTRRKKRAGTEGDEDDAVSSTTLVTRYNIADTSREAINVVEWVYANRTDPAMEVWPTS